MRSLNGHELLFFLCVLYVWVWVFQMGTEGDHIVDVHVNKMYDMTSSSMDRDPGEWNNIALARRKNGPSKSLSCTAVFVDR